MKQSQPATEAPAGHEHQLFDPGRQALQRGDGLRALQRQQRHLGHGDDFAARADFGLDVRDVAHLAGAVDDHEQPGDARVAAAAVEEHQVVDDAAFVIEQQAVALLAGGQVDHVDRHQRLERGRRVGAYQAQLAHVGHVEQAGGLARVQVLGHQARRGIAPAW
jgi:hypothetical protein